MRTLTVNSELTGMCRVIPDIPYINRNGREYHMQIIQPWAADFGKKFPAVLFVQGCAWTTPDVYGEIPQLSRLAERGYVVATITHRDCMEGHPYPAYLQDVKSAIRFLRQHASEYGIEPEHIGLWGTSSGANASMLVAMTQGEPSLTTEDNRELSEKINFVVDCFGPIDMKMTMEYSPDAEFDDILEHAVAPDEAGTREEKIRKMSPLQIAEAGKDYPPMLLLHGDKDMLISYEQSKRLYERLKELGYEPDMVTVQGADHESNFWSKEVLELIFRFIDENI